MPKRLPFALIVLSCGLLADCSNSPVAPTAPPLTMAASVPGSRPQSGIANWTGDAVVTATGGRSQACGWGTGAGDARPNVEWRVTLDGATVTLDEDMQNWPTDDVPYEGSVDGRQFSAAYSNGSDYLKYVCQFRGSTLTGTFSSDFASFDATETLAWGPPDSETVVQRRWVGRKL